MSAPLRDVDRRAVDAVPHVAGTFAGLAEPVASLRGTVAEIVGRFRELRGPFGTCAERSYYMTDFSSLCADLAHVWTVRDGVATRRISGSSERV